MILIQLIYGFSSLGTQVQGLVDLDVMGGDETIYKLYGFSVNIFLLLVLCSVYFIMYSVESISKMLSKICLVLEQMLDLEECT